MDPDVVFLNQGSFGALPRPVHEEQLRWRNRLRQEPVRFFVEELEPALDAAREACSRFVGCDSEGFAFVSNATTGVNTVIKSLPWNEGDEILTSAHEYNACNNILRWAEANFGAHPVFADIPWPIESEDQVVEAILAKVTGRTRLAMISHITSPTALVFPVARLVRLLADRGIDTIVDGAHAPGHLPLNVAEIGAAYYTGNFHKWVCSPVASGFLHVREDRRYLIRPLVVSHGANSARHDRSLFRLEFDYAGTFDASAFLSVPTAISSMASLVPGGWPEIMARNRTLAMAARDHLCKRLSEAPLAPDSMTGCMACIRLPDRPADLPNQTRYHDALQDELIKRHRIQVPVNPFPRLPKRHVRVSAQLYNSLEQYQYLGEALIECLKR